jgi:hypothetical protein
MFLQQKQMLLSERASARKAERSFLERPDMTADSKFVVPFILVEPAGSVRII